MMNYNLKISQWNVRGLGHSNRVKRLQNWIKNHKLEGEILCLQELKINAERATFQLNLVAPGCTFILDAGEEGVVGSALVIPKRFNVTHTGTKGDGSFAWATINTQVGILSIGSVYAANVRRRRKELWEWMTSTLTGENWILSGDWNMAEQQDDSAGPSALIHGSEARAWKRLVDQWDLHDNYHCAGHRAGPHFTRQARRDNRFDQARLDRCYSSRGNSWCSFIKEIVHDGSQTLSDHLPVICTVTLKEDAALAKRRSTYFKMDVHDLEMEGVAQRVEELWMESQSAGRDPRVNIDIGWSLIRRFLKSEKRRRALMASRTGDDLAQLNRLRQTCGTDPTIEEMEQISILERSIRERENREAQLVRLRSKVRWIQQGEAPTKFFFNHLKAKRDRECFHSLKLASGETTHDEDEILNAIQHFYSRLYAEELPSSGSADQLRDTLRLIDKTLDEEDCRSVLTPPTEEEIDRMVLDLPNEKSPGLDGVTNEILKRCWTFMRPAYLNMFQAFWTDGKMTTTALAGVIKLIPKGQNTNELSKWRPLTMLNHTEKLAAKLVASRIKGVITKLVDPQQTGFIEGRDIFDNLITFRMAQDFTRQHKQAAVFLKLDFAKAYDRVLHHYLWAVLRAMHFPEHLVTLIQGLTVGASSKVHTNGLFTDSFPLGRGVRQGCPLSPLLFALTTQPLMLLFKKKLAEGNLLGLPIDNQISLCYQLFADDTGLFLSATENEFQQAREVIAIFEDISGALLNVGKSVMVPIFLPESQYPDWMDSVGCVVAKPGEVQEYLGCPIGYRISPQNEVNFLMDKLRKKLRPWTLRCLSLASRVIYIKHVLRSVPAYHLLLLTPSNSGFESMEQLCRRFLWGESSPGHPKRALVGWATMAKEKSAGGVGFYPFIQHAMALKMRHVSKLFTSEQSEWSRMVKSMMLKGLKRGILRKETK